MKMHVIFKPEKNITLLRRATATPLASNKSHHVKYPMKLAGFDTRVK